MEHAAFRWAKINVFPSRFYHGRDVVASFVTRATSLLPFFFLFRFFVQSKNDIDSTEENHSTTLFSLFFKIHCTIHSDISFLSISNRDRAFSSILCPPFLWNLCASSERQTMKSCLICTGVQSSAIPASIQPTSTENHPFVTFSSFFFPSLAGSG